MMRNLIFTFLFTCSALVAQAGAPDGIDAFFENAQFFFNKYVNGDDILYSRLKANPVQLDALINDIADIRLGGQSDQVKMAFYINSYNVLVVKSVVQNLPIASPLDVDGFFKKKQHSIAGELMTLDQLENEKIRKPYQDARIHFVLVCGAKGCPPILNTAYLPSTLESQLQNQTLKALNDPGFVRYDAATKKLELSKIIEWYQVDFGSTQREIIDYINRFRKEKISPSANVTYYEYDWKLNGK